MAGAGGIGVLALEQVRDADGELHHFQPALNVALRVRHGLAVLAGEQFREGVVFLVGEFEELHQHAGALLRVLCRPAALRGPGVLHRLAQFLAARQRHARLHFTRGRIVDVRETPAAPGHAAAADEMSDVVHDVAPGS
jgi:hypothetical protein